MPAVRGNKRGCCKMQHPYRLSTKSPEASQSSRLASRKSSGNHFRRNSFLPKILLPERTVRAKRVRGAECKLSQIRAQRSGSDLKGVDFVDTLRGCCKMQHPQWIARSAGMMKSMCRQAQFMFRRNNSHPKGTIHTPAGCQSSYPTSFQNSMSRSGMEAFCSGVRYSHRNFSVLGLASCTWTNIQGLSALMMR